MTRDQDPAATFGPAAEQLGQVSETRQGAADCFFHALRSLQRMALPTAVQEPLLGESHLKEFLAWSMGLLGEGSPLEIRVTQRGFLLAGARVSSNGGIAEICEELRRDGLRSIRILPGISDNELCRFVEFLATFTSGPDSWEGFSGTSRLLSARFAHVAYVMQFAASPASTPQAEGAGAPLPAQDWSQEILVEEYRNLSLEVGLLLLNDLGNVRAGAEYRRPALEAVGKLFVRLMKEGRIYEAIRLLDLADDGGSVLPDEMPILLEFLDEFRDEAFLHPFLRSLSPRADPAIAKFMLRLGPSVATMLLREARRGRSSPLWILLETMVKIDSEPFVEALSSAALETRETALSFLLAAGDRIPASCLERLCESDSSWLRSRALKILVEFHPECVPAEQAIRYLDDPNESVRAQGLRWISGSRDSKYLPKLIHWFRRKQKNMSFQERRKAIATIAEVGQEQVLPVLKEWIEQKSRFSLRSSDRDNRLCAIFALGCLEFPAAKEYLAHLIETHNEEIRLAARQAMREPRA